MVLPEEYYPNVSRRFKEFKSNGMNDNDDGCSSDDEMPIDVEKEAEKRVIHGLFRLESLSEPTNNNDEVENEEKEEEYQSEAPDENEEYNMNTKVSSSGLVYGVVDEQDN
ncbi:hypothetical protein BLNAU_10037 [Blattamonas nauphoetae]|uniref:Uncharacterized protein n=1 Tax=Blattamonas nauphoetae TaxID=2049346 RepID=A0ABQ9XUD7_9EUKA|nr:hypothetical protein BLNAU_10037 [Blattamonas nauphoetae]